MDEKQYVLDEEARRYLHLRMIANIKVASLPQEGTKQENNMQDLSTYDNTKHDNDLNDNTMHDNDFQESTRHDNDFQESTRHDNDFQESTRHDNDLRELQNACSRPVDYSPRPGQLPFKFEEPVLSPEQSARLYQCWLDAPLPVVGPTGKVVYFKPRK